MTRHQRDSDALTPEGLAKLVAVEVAAQLKDVRDSFERGMCAAANSIVGQLALAARTDAANEIKDAAQQLSAHSLAVANAGAAASQQLSAAVLRIEEFLKTCVNTGMDRLWQEVREHHAQMLAALEKLCKDIRTARNDVERASIERLTEIIGKEIERYELEQLIGAELRAAVREAVREVVGQKMDP